MAKMVPYSLSPYGTGDIKDAADITISGGVATLTVAQTGNIGVGCCIEFDDPTVYVYIAPNRLGFDSGGTTELKVGDKIQGGTSNATGVVRALEVDSGSWAGGDAAGYIYFSKTSGTWQNNEQVNRIKPTTSNNIATADGTLQGNIGNGDTQFVVKQANGTDAANVGSAETITSIHHEYASLSAYEAGFTDANHINDTDLTNADVVAYACCYYDHVGSPGDADTTSVTINWSGTTDADNYLQCYTPTGNAESINNQRHPGYWDSNKYLLQVTGGAIESEESYTRVEGIQVSYTTSGANQFGLKSDSAGSYEIFSHNIITVSNAGANNTYAILIYGTLVKVFNNIVFDMTGGANTGGIVFVEDGVYVSNNTVHNCNQGFRLGTGSATLKNNIANNCTNSFYINLGSWDSASTHNVTDIAPNAESAFGATHSTGTADTNTENHLVDTGATFQSDGVQVNSIVKNTTDTTYGYVTAVNSETDLTLDSDVFPDGDEGYEVYTNMYGAVTFEDEGGDDFHLAHNDTVAKNKGVDLSADANLPIWNDIDGEERG